MADVCDPRRRGRCAVTVEFSAAERETLERWARRMPSDRSARRMPSGGSADAVGRVGGCRRAGWIFR